MPEVVIKRGAGWDTVEILPGVDGGGLSAAIGQVVITHGGEPRGDGFVLSNFGLLRGARELAVTLARHGATAVYDAHLRAFLGVHVEEVRARGAASTGSLVPEAEMLTAARLAGFDRALKPIQAENVRRLLFLRHGANFSVPGAGKTTALLAVHAALRGQGRVDRLLVVAPKNAMISWEDEIEACFPGRAPRTARLVGGAAGVRDALADDPEVCFITYQLLPNVQAVVGEWAFAHKTHIVLDESHRIKGGADGFVAGAALRLCACGVRRDVLSGTPLPQSTEDLRPQFEFLWPGQRVLPDSSSPSADPVLLDEIQSRVGPLYVRTTKKDLGLRAPDVEPVSVPLGPVQRELYDLLRSEARRRASGMSSVDRAFLRRLGRHVVRLIEAASNPVLLTQGGLVDEEEEAWSESAADTTVRAFDLLREFARREKPAKLRVAAELSSQILNADKEAKVVVWTTFIQNIHAVASSLREYGPVLLYGAVGTGDEDDPETREGRIRQFHRDPACRVMVANPAACGEGISLHRVCHHAVYVDRTFNAAHYLQSVDRIHRLGLDPGQATRVFVLEAQNTIDSRIASRLKSKIDVMSAILNDPGLAALAYDPEDVVEEFPAGVEAADVEEIVDHLASEGDQP